MLDKNNSATETVTDLVNIKRDGKIYSMMLCSLPRSCLVHKFDRFDSEGWFSCDQVIFLMCFVWFLVKSMQHLNENTQFPDFLFPQVVQKH